MPRVTVWWNIYVARVRGREDRDLERGGMRDQPLGKGGIIVPPPEKEGVTDPPPERGERSLRRTQTNHMTGVCPRERDHLTIGLMIKRKVNKNLFFRIYLGFTS